MRPAARGRNRTRPTALALLRRQLDDDRADFRPGQWEAIASIVNDTARLLVVQRTGWGKSSAYFIATRIPRDLDRGPTLIVSPLLALMRNRPPQREQQNTVHQCRNLDGVFEIRGDLPAGPALLVDDVVDSRWTLTVVAALLRAAGCGLVWPVALASSNPGA